MSDVNNFEGEKAALLEWIEKVRAKKREFETRVRKNLRVEAILNSTLDKSVSLLRVRQQQQRLERFKLLREEALRKRAALKSARPELFYPIKKMKLHVDK
jgi:hypothetical protein